MDDTQRLQSDEDEDEISVDRDKPVGNLHMFAGVHGPAQDFPIYPGQNLIGRHASCDITLPAQSVSKKHAILEVKADCHTICDNGSLNKTRRSKAALNPHVRYAVSDGDFLLFADVACRYTICKKIEEVTVHDDSDDDSVLVPGTQEALAIEKTPGAAIRRMGRGAVLARDSGDEDEDGEHGRCNDRGEGPGSSMVGQKTTPGSIFSPITDTIVPESDEENDTSISKSPFPSLNLRCDSDTDSHGTPTRGGSSTPSSFHIFTPPAPRDQKKNEIRVIPVDREEKVATVTEVKQGPIREDVSTVEEDGGSEQKTDSSLADDSESSGKPGLEVEDGSPTSDVKVTDEGELSNLTIDQVSKNECEKTLEEDSVKKSPEIMSTTGQSVEEDGEASSGTDVAQRDSGEINPDNDACPEKDNVKTTQEADSCLKSNTGDDDGDTVTSRTDVMTLETHETKTDEGQDQNGVKTVGTSDVVFHMDSDTDLDEDNATTSVAASEKGNGDHTNVEPATDVDELDKPADEKLEQIDETQVSSDGDTDVEEDAKKVTSKNENANTTTDGDTGVKMDEYEDDSVIKEPCETTVDSITGIEDTINLELGVDKSSEASVKTTEEKREEFNLDSDTDVEDEEDISDTGVPKELKTISLTVRETNDDLHLDGDTGMGGDAEITSSELATDEQESRITSTSVEEMKDGFHLDSDTDVDEDEPRPGTSNAEAIHTGEHSKVESTEHSVDKNETDATNKETAFHLDSETDVDEDEGISTVPGLEKTEGAEETSRSDIDQNETNVTNKETAAFHLDSDTEDEDEGQSTEPVLEETQAVGRELCNTNVPHREEVKIQEPLTTVTSDEGTGVADEDVETQIAVENTVDEDDFGVDDDLMATQCYLEPQVNQSSLPEEEEATQAYIFSSTCAEPDPFKRPADPIGVLQISAVSANTSEEETDENEVAETQLFCQDDDKTAGPSFQETPVLGDESADDQEMTQLADEEEESSKRVQQASLGTQEDTQTVSQYLATRSPQETGTWVHLKQSTPTSVWIKGVQSDGDVTDVQEEPAAAKDSTQDEQVEAEDLEATQAYTMNVPTQPEQNAQDDVTPVPTMEETNAEPGATTEPVTESTPSELCSTDIQPIDDDATQAYSLSVPVSDSKVNGTCNLQLQADDAAQPSGGNLVNTEGDATQPCSLIVPNMEENAKENLDEDKEMSSTRRGLSLSKNKQEPAETVLITEHLEETLAVPESHAQEPAEEDAGEPGKSRTDLTLSEIKDDVRTDKGRRRGRRISPAEEAGDKTTGNGGASTAPLRANRNTAENKPSTSCVTEKRGRNQVTKKSEVKEPNGDECTEQVDNFTVEESVSENLPVDPTEKTQSSEDDTQENVAYNTSVDVGSDRINESAKDPVSVVEQEGSGDGEALAAGNEEILNPSGNSEQLESESSSADLSKKALKTRSRGVAIPKVKITGESEDQDLNFERMASSSKTLQSQELRPEEGPSAKRRASRRSQGLMVEPEVQKNGQSEEIPANNANTEKISPVDPSPGKEKSRKSERNLKQEVKEESETIDHTACLSSRKSGRSKASEKEKEDQGTSSDVSVSNTMSRRTRNNCKEEKNVDNDTAKKTRGRKAANIDKKTEEIGDLDSSNTTETQTARKTRACKELENVVPVQEAVSRRTRRGSLDSEVTKFQDEQSKKPGRTKKSSKEEVNSAPNVDNTVTETQDNDLVGERTSRRTRKNSKDDDHTKSELEPEISSSRKRSKTLVEERKEIHGCVEAKEGRRKGEEATQETLPTPERESQWAAGRSRRTAAKEVAPLVSTPVAIRKRGQATKADVEAKKKKSDDAVVQEDVREEYVETKAASSRTRRSLLEAEVSKLQDNKSKKSGTARKASKEEAKTDTKFEDTMDETQTQNLVGKRTSSRTRKNVNDDQNMKNEQGSERSSSRTRTKTLVEKGEEMQRSTDAKEEQDKVEETQQTLSTPEGRSRTAAGRSRTTAIKEESPVSTPVAVRRRGRPKAEVGPKRKKSDDLVEREEAVEEVVPAPRRGRPRRLLVARDDTQAASEDGKDISPPSQSPAGTKRQRPSSAASNPSEVQTPRRTNRLSAGTTSPCVPPRITPKVLFTGVVDATGEDVIRTLGGEVAESVFDCTHLVTDRVRRTVKFLCALARGVPIVTLDWIDKCKKSGCFLSPAAFLVHDKEQEKIFSFVLSESLKKAKKRPLFEGYEIHVTANVKPEPEHMKDIIRCSGATFLPKMPRSFKGKCVIVSCQEDAARVRSVPSSVPITSAEFILSGILRQEVDPAAYLLNPAPAAAPTPAKRRR